MKQSLLLESIAAKTARVCIIGVGYVGTAVAQSAARAGFTTVGIDLNEIRVKSINESSIPHFTATSDFEILKTADIVAVCVPTPVTHDNVPDFSILTDALKEVARHIKKGQLITIESSISPGTSRQMLLPLLEKGGFKVGRDFYFAHSPERIDPGNTAFDMHDIPKIVGAMDPHSLEIAVAFYQKLVKQVIPVSTIETAELTKVLENTFRLVNISFVNELLPYAEKLKINLWEVIEAASTKPFGFLAHYPGPGAGGYCIPVLPYFLLQSAQKLGVTLPITKAAAHINETQPTRVTSKTLAILQRKSKNGRLKVLLIGISYKKNLSDSRFSTSLKVWEELEKNGVEVSYHDPHAERVNGHMSLPLTHTTLKKHDMAVITTAHSGIDYELLVNSGVPILDTQDVLRQYNGEQIHRL